MELAAVTLDDKYTLRSGRIFLSGVQALVRLPLMQRQRDAAQGLNTAGFISGYRGSPLGGYDQSLWRAKRFLESNHIHFQPGVNEDLAATAVWGSQQTSIFEGAKYDGVFAMWYGKGPGVDRCGDVFKHGNAAGTSPYGGVLLLAGDDHAARSSTLPHQSEHAFIAAMIPVLNPANVQEYLDYGLLGWAMSRYSGCWIGFKCISETVEASASVAVDPQRIEVVIPEDFEMPPDGLHMRWPDDRLVQERRLQRHRIYAALAFARANRLDRVVIDTPEPRFGIVTTGKAYLDVRQALEDLGIDDRHAAEIGLKLYKVGMSWPLEREGLRPFAEGLEEILVVEEKRAIIENQLKEQLYNWSAAVRPRVVGKFDEKGDWLLPAEGELSPARIASVIAQRIGRFHTSERIRERLAFLDAKERSLARAEAKTVRTPYFCSGCPHNTSTKVPEGSMALAGIGCHFMAVWMDRDTITFSHMGGEGASWIGLAPFTETRHVFANLGDGTYYHSGLLAIRAAISAGISITYKILFNDAVAMTGGQPVEGGLAVPEITQQVYHEGVRRIAVVSDEPKKYPPGSGFAPGVSFHHRDELDRVQRELRQWPGVSVMVYDQTCAAEMRRRRKRGLFPDPPRRVFINDLVCEGCGDCSEQSNCLSVEPLETELGRKRWINQSSCNKDFSCLKGFCPSFVTVHGGAVRKPAARAEGAPPGSAQLPRPEAPTVDGPYNILITGVGGTGVITVGALLGMAAHLEGKGCSVLDMTGLAQKGGAVLSHVRIAKEPEDINAVRIASGGADLVLGCDVIVSAGDDALRAMESGTSFAVVNSHLTPTAGFTRDPDVDFHGEELKTLIREAAGADRCDFVDATGLATALMGDAIATNLFLTGYAFQRGLVPLSLEAIERAIVLNAVAADANKRAFAWGRLAAHDAGAVAAAAKPLMAVPETPAPAKTLEEIVAKRVDFLTAYQNRAYAERYRRLVERVAAAQRDKAKGLGGLAEAVARYYFKLLAYKDEYEVARLYVEGTFRRELEAQFEGDFKLSFHMAPPLLARRDADTGELKKIAFGPWLFTVFKLLAKLKGLRGTRLDPFGHSAERRRERALIGEYEATVAELIAGLGPDSHALAVEIASVPEHIRGFGHVKRRHLEAAKQREAELLAAFRAPRPHATAAE